MADRYWVGGTGTWDASTTTNWATTSGGAGGASAPTSADNAYFDGNSDAGAPFTVTISTGAVCADVIIGDGSTVTVLDQTMTLAGSVLWTIYGSLYFPATNLTRTFVGPVTFAATTTGHTITTNGVTLTVGSNISTAFDGVGGEWTLGSALTTSAGGSGAAQVIFINAGSLKTNNYNVTTGGIICSTSANAKNIELGSSTVTLVNSVRYALNLGATLASTNTTLDAGTSTIILSNAEAFITAGGATFYNVEYSSNSLYRTSFRGNLTFNNLTFATRSTSGVGFVFLNPTSVTVNGTLSVQSGNTDPTKRVFFQAANDNFGADSVNPVIGSSRTLTAAVVNFGAGADFRDITAAGAAAPWDVSSVYGGDCKNNSGITFPAPKTVYRIGTGNWSATQWAATSGGSPAAASFPLAQDTAVFDANTATGTHTLDAAYNIGSLDMSALTVAVTLATTNAAVYGNMTLSANVTLTGLSLFTFAGQGTTQTITSAGRTFTQALNVNSPSGTVTLADALTTSLTFSLTAGALDLGNQVLTCSNFASSNSNTRSIAFGTGKISLSGNNLTIWSASTITGFTYTGTPLVEATYSGSVGTRTVAHAQTGASQAAAVSFSFISGSDTVLFLNVSRPLGVDFSGFSGLWARSTNSLSLYGDLVLSSAMTVESSSSSLSFVSTSGVQQITTAGKTLDFPITIDAPGATVQLVDNLTMGSTRTFTLTQGTLALNDKTLTTGLFSSSNSNVREINFGSSGELRILEGGTSFNAATGTNLTTSGTGTINMVNAAGKTFVGGGATYPTLNQGGTSALAITGANTFADITNVADGYADTQRYNLFTYTEQLNNTGAWDRLNGITVSADATTAPDGSSSADKLVSAASTNNFVIATVSTAGSVGLNTFSVYSKAAEWGFIGITINGGGFTDRMYAIEIATGTATSIAGLGGNIVFISESVGSGWIRTWCTVSLTSAAQFRFGPRLNNSGVNQAGDGVSGVFFWGAQLVTGPYPGVYQKVEDASTFTPQADAFPVAITFPSGVTTSVQDFSVGGTLGNLVTLNASTPGSRAILNRV